jgi:hypothetical protein
MRRYYSGLEDICPECGHLMSKKPGDCPFYCFKWKNEMATMTPKLNHPYFRRPGCRRLETTFLFLSTCNES